MLALVLLLVDPADAALTTAAACLDRDDHAAAVPHLRAYLRANPDDTPIRLQLAAALDRSGRPAAGEYERVAWTAAPRLATRAHTRLMALAEDAGDDYRAHLHRGLGLARLADGWDADPSRRDADAAERVRVRAVTELRQALAERPDDVRANLHLAKLLDQLGQPGPARAALANARRGLPDPTLTATESARLAD